MKTERCRRSSKRNWEGIADDRKIVSAHTSTSLVSVSRTLHLFLRFALPSDVLYILCLHHLGPAQMLCLREVTQTTQSQVFLICPTVFYHITFYLLLILNIYHNPEFSYLCLYCFLYLLNAASLNESIVSMSVYTWQFLEHTRCSINMCDLPVKKVINTILSHLVVDCRDIMYVIWDIFYN